MEPLVAAYWKRVRPAGQPFGCWEWTGAHVNQYAYLSATNPERLIRVSRWLYQRLYEPIPPKGIILHSCDNRGCVNPGHLWLGTQADNMRDMASKGRSLLGESNPHAKMTAAQVIELRQLRAAGWKLTQLAERYGIDFASVGNIARRQSWKHL